MIYGVGEKLFIAGLTIIFLTVVIGGTFGVELARLYVKCRRIEKEYELERRERDKYDRWERERAEWFAIKKEQDERIERMHDELVELTRHYERAKRLMDRTNLKGEQL